MKEVAYVEVDKLKLRLEIMVDKICVSTDFQNEIVIYLNFDLVCIFLF